MMLDALSSFREPSPPEDGREARGFSLFIGHNPHFLNPDVRLSAAFLYTALCKDFRSPGKVSLEIDDALPLQARFHSSSIFLQALLRGAKKDTSKGYIKCDDLGGKKTKLMLFSSQDFIT